MSVDENGHAVEFADGKRIFLASFLGDLLAESREFVVGQLG